MAPLEPPNPEEFADDSGEGLTPSTAEGSRLEELRRRLAVIESSVILRNLADPILNPAFTERFRGASAFSQWMAVLFLPFLVMLSLIMLTVFDAVLLDLFVPGGSLATSVSFLLSLINIGAFVIAAYVWFLWVKTGGFGLFEIY